MQFTLGFAIKKNNWKSLSWAIFLPFPYLFSFQIFSVQFSHSVMSNSLQPDGLQHARPPCPLSTLRVYSNSCPLSRWCHPAISSSVVPFSSCLQSFPASGSLQMSQFYASAIEFQLQYQSQYFKFLKFTMQGVFPPFPPPPQDDTPRPDSDRKQICLYLGSSVHSGLNHVAEMVLSCALAEQPYFPLFFHPYVSTLFIQRDLE